MNKRKIGAEWEIQAMGYLQERGVRIVAHNYRIRQGEIDIIGYHKGYLVFVEVKYRKNTVLGDPSEAVDIRKQKKICVVANYYRFVHGIGDYTPIRYDVITICDKNITWYQNAFMHVGR